MKPIWQTQQLRPVRSSTSTLATSNSFGKCATVASDRHIHPAPPLSPLCLHTHTNHYPFPTAPSLPCRPALVLAIESASFVAVDCELTGIGPRRVFCFEMLSPCVAFCLYFRARRRGCTPVVGEHGRSHPQAGITIRECRRAAGSYHSGGVDPDPPKGLEPRQPKLKFS